MLEKVKSIMPWMVVATEVSHIFCCVLPTLVTVFTVVVNAGLLAASPVLLTHIHDVMHAYELPIIFASGFMIFMGWAVHLASQQTDCHATGCLHSTCGQQKNRNARILQIATFLFLVNIAIYAFVHKNAFDLDIFVLQDVTHHH